MAAAVASSTVAVEPGKSYRVNMALNRANGLGPEWIVLAMRSAYPGAEVSNIEHYDSSSAVVVMRWAGPAGKLSVGSTVSPNVAGLQVPFEAMPVGTIRSAELVDVVQGSSAQSVFPALNERTIVLRLSMSAAILLTVWYLSSKVKRKR